MRAAVFVPFFVVLLAGAANAQSCTCSCCTGNYCTPSSAGTFSVSSSTACSQSACNSQYPTLCPASGSSGSSSASYSTSTPSSSGYTALASRTSVSPSSCIAPSSCSYQCSASYTISLPASGNTMTLTPGSVSGCTCYTGTGTIPNSGVLSGTTFTFQDGSTAALTSSTCQVSVVATTQGVTCTGTYAITGSSACPASSSSSSASIMKPAAALVAAAGVAMLI
jgi:hypothetical protein